MAALPQTWNNNHFFKDIDDPAIPTTVQNLQSAIQHLTQDCTHFKQQTEQGQDAETLMASLQTLQGQRLSILTQLSNVYTFVHSVLSVDTQNTTATTWLTTLQQVDAAFEQAWTPVDVYLTATDDAFIEALVAQPDLAPLEFGLKHQRKLKDQLLPVTAERLVAGLSVDGLHGWGNLYDELAGSLKCEVAGETIGLAKASNLLSHRDRNLRRQAWQGINGAWTGHQSTVAAILNAINGWRLEEAQQRAHTRPLHYLDRSCHRSHMERATLEAMVQSTYEQREIGQRAVKAMAKALDLPQMAPWDLQAPAPRSGADETIGFEAAIHLIAEAFAQLTPEMGDFAVMMAQKGWIDGKPTPNRATGAYCTGFVDPREPRVFLTFEGTMTNVMTLAHELGHAWHTWTMRDLPLDKTAYPATLAETASIFAETLVRDALFNQAQNPGQQLEIAWEDALSAAAFVLNIPARFEFEKQLVEARKSGFVVAERLKVMMETSWQQWYEDSLCEYDPLFWASKLHFSISSLSFYNYPYLFGYLFSLGIYAQQGTYGDRFPALYRAILRDTGTMTAEDLVTHHLQQDIQQPQFWQDSLAIVDRAITRFETLVDQTVPVLL
jgi:oligoendopeptidase F